MKAARHLKLVTTKSVPRPPKQTRGLPFEPTPKHAGELEMTSRGLVEIGAQPAGKGREDGNR